MIQFKRNDERERARPAESLLVYGFLAVILLGTALLALPAASQSGRSIGLFDSLFTAFLFPEESKCMDFDFISKVQE